MASSGLRILDEEDGDSGKSGSSYKMPSIGTAASSKRRVSYFYDPEIGSKMILIESKSFMNHHGDTALVLPFVSFLLLQIGTMAKVTR